MLLDQQVREKIIFQKYLTQWWDYMSCISEECGVITELKICSNKCEQKLNLKDFDKVFKDSFGSGSNLYLASDMEKLRNSGIDTFPSVSINFLKMRGSLEG